MKKITKKFIPFCLAILLICSLAACGSKSGNNPPMTAMSMLPEDASPADIVIADFMDKANGINGVKYDDIAVLAEDLLKGDHIPFAGATMEVEEGYLNGFTEEVTGFEKGYMFGPSIGSIPFIGYVFEVKKDVDMQNFLETLEKNADLRWNVCTQADEMNYGSVNQRACFVMAPASFEE